MPLCSQLRNSVTNLSFLGSKHGFWNMDRPTGSTVRVFDQANPGQRSLLILQNLVRSWQDSWQDVLVRYVRRSCTINNLLCPGKRQHLVRTTRGTFRSFGKAGSQLSDKAAVPKWLLIMVFLFANRQPLNPDFCLKNSYGTFCHKFISL